MAEYLYNNDTFNESREGQKAKPLGLGGYLNMKKGKQTPNVLLFQVDQESLRGYLKELSKEPHIAAGRRDK